MRKKLFPLILVLFNVWHLHAQRELADSIQKVLSDAIPDTVRAFNMVMLAMYTEPVNMGKAHDLYKEAVDFSLSRRLDYYAGLALYYEATPYFQSGNYTQQRDNLNRAIDLLKNSEHYKAKSQLGAVYGGLSNYYQAIEKTDSAIIASLNSIKILEELKKYRSLAISCMNLAMTYQRLKLPEKQKEYADKGIIYGKLSGEKDLIMLSFLQRAHYLNEIGNYSEAKTCTDSATLYFSETYDFSRKQNYYLLKAITFQNVNQYDSAILYFQKSYENAKQIASRWNMAEPLMQIGHVYFQQQNYSQAEKYVKMGLEIAETDSIKVFMKEGYGILSDIYKSTGDYRQAYDLLTKYNQIRDTIQSEDRKKFALNLEKKYETEKKESQSRLQELEIERRKSINHGLLALTFSFIIIMILVFRNFRHRNRLQTAEIMKLTTEKKLWAAEAVLKGEELERSRLAKDLHDGLGGMLSGVKYSLNSMKESMVMSQENVQAFERSLDMLDSSINEMRRVSHNMMPQSLVTFGLHSALRDYCNEISKSGALNINFQSFDIQDLKPDPTASLAIYRIVQELIHNILKHASAKNAIVQISQTNQLLSITIEDDGIGFDTSFLENTRGMGWTNIRNRIDFLKGKIDVRSERGKGTSVYIEIDLNEH